MNGKASFSLKNRNPDVLTSIANLSNDEVFTPPSFANQMLDTIEEAWAKNNKGARIWENKNVTFLDPFTKSGVFLREITRRLSKGLEKQIPDVQERVNHILTKQVFGVAITELTSLLARRSLYCSKYANGKHSICTEFDTPEGNIWFERTEHTWIGGKEKVITVDDDGKDIEVTLDGTCKFCGAKQKEYERGLEAESHAYTLIHTNDPEAWVKNTFGEEMQFDVIVGNPPYQLETGGSGRQARPLYHMFVDQAKKLEPRLLTMVIPSRWFAGGMGLDGFRSQMLNDRQVTRLVDYLDAAEVFPQVDVPGGICYFLWESGANEDCKVKTIFGGQETELVRPLNQFDTFVRQHLAVSILEKVLNHGEESITSLVSATRPFGLQTKDRPDGAGDVRLVSSGGEGMISDARVTAGRSLIHKWKVMTSKTSHDHGGNPDKKGMRRVLSRLELLGPGAVCTESYIVLGGFESKEEAANCLSYLRTRFARFLISLLSFSQDITRERFRYVPMVDFVEPWSDSILAAKYGLSPEEVGFIESSIHSMEGPDA